MLWGRRYDFQGDEYGAEKSVAVMEPEVDQGHKK